MSNELMKIKDVRRSKLENRLNRKHHPTVVTTTSEVQSAPPRRKVTAIGQPTTRTSQTTESTRDRPTVLIKQSTAPNNAHLRFSRQGKHPNLSEESSSKGKHNLKNTSYKCVTMPANGELRNILVEEAQHEASSSGTSSEDEEVCTKYSNLTLKKTTYAPDAEEDTKQDNWFASLPNAEQHEDFIKKAVDIMLEKAIFKGLSRSSKVLDYHSPEEMQQLFDFDLKDEPASQNKLLQLLDDTIKYSVKTGHPYFVNQLFSAVDPYGLVGQWLTDALNPSVYTYEVSPVFTLMEEVVLKEMRKIVGFEDGKGDGIFCPGGSMANAYAISCARYFAMPEIKTKGLHGLPRLVLFTSEDAHYSIKKMASFLGLGMDNVYLIRTDSRGKMCPAHLEQEVQRALAEGAKPFMVSLTAGTTVLGAFDPIEPVADVCERHGLWLHVDAAWGGGALMSQKYRGLLKGVERADSVTWNPHKLLTAPQQCSTFLLRHEGILNQCHSTSASYLFQKDKFYDIKYDTGDKHVQCGRRADVLKFWYMWKAKGTTGLEAHIDKVFENSEYFTDNIKHRDGFKMVLENPECTNICFWYIPPSLRRKENDEDFNDKLHKVAPKIKEKMMKEGSMMVTYQQQKGLPNFFRIVFQSSGLEKSDMLHLISEFERLGADL